MTGVLRAWRGRGIARALKAAEIAWAKEHGYERLETQNEERNEPIRRLNVAPRLRRHARLDHRARSRRKGPPGRRGVRLSRTPTVTGAVSGAP